MNTKRVQSQAYTSLLAGFFSMKYKVVRFDAVLSLDDICTWNCAFCAVNHGKPGIADADEPEMVAQTARKLGLRHVVVTSVTRDDLADGGAGQFAATIKAIRRETQNATIEVLIPDFRGQPPPLRRFFPLHRMYSTIP